MRATSAVARQEVALLRSEAVPVALYFVMPLVVMAFVKGAFDIFLEVKYPGSDASGADLAAPGQATMFGFMSLATFGYFFLGEYGWGTWNRVRVMGVRPSQIILGKAAVAYVQQLALFTFVMVCGALLFGLSVQGSLVAVLVLELALASCIVAYGICACALSSTQAQFNAFAYLGALVMAGIGGALTPFETLPSWAQWLAPATPTYWAVRGFEAVILDGAGLAEVRLEVLVLGLFAVGLLLVGSWIFDPEKPRSTWA